MANQIAKYITKEFPEYVELKNILDLSSITWNQYGISAADLSKLDGYTIKLIRMLHDR